jgi:hypothetical protein
MHWGVEKSVNNCCQRTGKKDTVGRPKPCQECNIKMDFIKFYLQSEEIHSANGVLRSEGG